MDNKDFKDLLDELKKETELKDIDKSFDSPEKNIEVKERENNDLTRRYSFVPREQGSGNKFNVIWSENKETLLFSLLSSIIVIMAGLLSSYDYIVIVGVISFMLFSVLVFITFFRYVLISYQKSKIPDELLNRIITLEKRVEFISKEKDYSGGDIGRVKKIEDEVDEIKTLLRTLLSSIKG